MKIEVQIFPPTHIGVHTLPYTTLVPGESGLKLKKVLHSIHPTNFNSECGIAESLSLPLGSLLNAESSRWLKTLLLIGLECPQNLVCTAAPRSLAAHFPDLLKLTRLWLTLILLFLKARKNKCKIAKKNICLSSQASCLQDGDSSLILLVLSHSLL